MLEIEELSTPVYVSARAAVHAVARWDAAEFEERRAMVQEACRLIEVRPRPSGPSNVLNPARLRIEMRRHAAVGRK